MTIINLLTLNGSLEEIQEVITSLTIDGDITTIVKPNTIRLYSIKSCPFAELIDISKTLPTVNFNIQYACEDLGQNVGEFNLINGEISHFNSPISGSDEAYEMAIEITGDDFFITDLLYGIEESDLKAEFPLLCAKLAFNFRKCNPIYPRFILDLFEKWAVEVEDYEFAHKVTENIKIQNIR